MKFLDIPALARINSFLDHVDVGDCVVTGELEAYSCKLAGLDKKLSRSLDAEVALGSSPLELSMSPVGPLAEPSSRKTLIYLILTLNQIYPDYDFSSLRASHFRKEAGLAAVEDAVDAHLLDVGRVWETTPGYGGGPPFLESLWGAIDSAVSLADCDVYAYRPGTAPGGGGAEGEGADPFGEAGSLWSLNFFFYDRRAKRIVYLGARGLSKAAAAAGGPSPSGLTGDGTCGQAVPGVGRGGGGGLGAAGLGAFEGSPSGSARYNSDDDGGGGPGRRPRDRDAAWDGGGWDDDDGGGGGGGGGDDDEGDSGGGGGGGGGRPGPRQTYGLAGEFDDL